MTFIDDHALRDAFIANTLERLGSLIVEQGDELIRTTGLPFPSRAVSTVLLLGIRGPISAADIARELDQPHQLVTQRIDLLLELRVIVRSEDPNDTRRKLLKLTPKGRRQYERLRQRLGQAQIVFQALFKEIGCDLTDVATRAMRALHETSIVRRVAALDSGSPEDAQCTNG